ncbi:nitrilase and fragile histidine triad fusion protein NitFhit-like [Anastrepha obliqua]|uniref:nitrilase and fragile histidine triad fusion protein NitFhit-like n=1 Tax=Anastrepha obliqua TaxID=95512 RepID=UPI002409D46C|nr:nitrilase and fragile histidine triad fusion protein NitFhit-like [Anastrepha obliqua]XP_054733402.1 nitrilase and fragile histidine triad fusion protein NitFhit-like [Anastrepha obliqua]
MSCHRQLFEFMVGKVTKHHFLWNNLSIRMSSNQSSKVIAIGQMCATNNKADNMRQVEELFAKAKMQCATFLFLPECCDFVGEHRKQTLELSEPLDGATMNKYKELAKTHRMWLSLGGIHESILDENKCKTEKIYNTHVLLNDIGEVVSFYRKLHLFDVETEEMRFRESDVVNPGTHMVPPVNTPIGLLGMQICYDLRFGEASSILRKSGAQVLTYPSAFAYSTGKAHWEILLRARAIENQCYVIAAAQIGAHNSKRTSWGHGLIVDPWGKVLANCENENLAVATAEIDLNKNASVRRNMPVLHHKRNDVYSLTAFGMGIIDITQDWKFANNTIRKETIFYETEHCFAFTNLRCVVKGHVLVSTKREMKRLDNLLCHEMCDLFCTVCKIQRMLEDFYGTTSATVTVQDGPDAGQTVPHVHFHIMPRRPGDFSENDHIYTRMDDRCLDQPDRSIEDRIAEAQKYRDFIKRQY